MPQYNLSPIILPQYVPNGAAAALSLIGGNPSVPAQQTFQIQIAHVANITGSPVSLVVWRVPAGQTADNAHIVVPSINIPAATQSNPYFDLTALWGCVLQVGDAIWAQAGTANALVVQADGVAVIL